MKFRTIDTSKTVNMAGGEAFYQSEKLELVSLLLTSFISHTYYESASNELKRLVKLVHTIPHKKFLAKAAIYARNEFGMRSITHALIGELACLVKNEPWLKNAIAQAIKRPDDILEIVAYYLLKHKNCGYKKGLSAALRKGIAQALGQFDEYQLAKYRSSKSHVKMVDIFNLIHPIPSASRACTFEKLIKGELKSSQTWEAKLSQSGQGTLSEEERKKNKEQAWAELIEKKQLGYFALLRNLRNIIEQAPGVLPSALEMLVDEKLIKKSLVLPFRYLTAIEQIEKISHQSVPEVLDALNSAAEIALDNVPVFNGRTLIALDTSASMTGQLLHIGSLFAACLIKKWYKNKTTWIFHQNKPDLLLFNDKAKFFNVSGADGLLTIASRIKRQGEIYSGGTDFNTIFNIRDSYDRVIILSDMQAWVGYNCPTDAFNAYKKRIGFDPFIYSVDLAGKGTMQFPEDKVCALAGFSEKIFDCMKLIENDKSVLLSKIESIEF